MSESKTIIPFPVYNYRIYVIFTDNLVDSAKNLVKKGFLKSAHWVDDTTDGFTVKMPNQSYTFVVLKRTATINHMVHEAYHAVTNMFNYIGANPDEEVFAYSIGYVVQFIANDKEKAQKSLDKRRKV
jgi:hypothetical protein